MKQGFDPADHDDVEIYKLLIGLVVPRPIGWIGSVSAAGAVRGTFGNRIRKEAARPTKSATQPSTRLIVA